MTFLPINIYECPGVTSITLTLNQVNIDQALYSRTADEGADPVFLYVLIILSIHLLMSITLPIN